jgi:hypothetical protein
MLRRLISARITWKARSFSILLMVVSRLAVFRLSSSASLLTTIRVSSVLRPHTDAELYLDTKMEKTFMMTWKSFTSIDTLIEGLIQRFRIMPPDGLKPKEHEEWKKQKQTLVRARYVNVHVLNGSILIFA